MQLDSLSAILGAVLLLAAAGFVYYAYVYLSSFSRLAHEAKSKSQKKDHRHDLKVLRTALAELAYVHLGYLGLGMVFVGVGLKTGALTLEPRFLAVMGIAGAAWALIVLVRGGFAFKDMRQTLSTPSDRAAPLAGSEGSVVQPFAG